MRLTIPHYYDFGPDRDLLDADLLGPDEWDSLRVNGRGIFRFPEDDAEWRRLVAESEWQERRARTITAWIEDLGVTSVASYGVGPGIVEAWLGELVPDVRLVLSDIAPRTVELLTAHFPELEVRLLDFCRDEPLDAELHLFNGVDTELNDGQWRDVLRRFSDRRVVIFPGITLGVKVLAGELWCRRPGRRPMRAGWWRTKGRFDELARPTHETRRMPAGRAGTGWMLEPRG